MLNINQLKSKWNKEKNSYAKQEVGSGSQKFVKDVLKSPEIFNLKEGLISAPDEKRKNEFTEESRTKETRRADVVIHINQDIKIPMEVERYGEIEKGFDQLMQYQKDVDKKFGILTDGFTWRFYNNAYLLKTFNINEIFKDPGLFLDFWQEYIKPENYYLSFFEEKGQLKILPEYLSVEKRRQDFFRDITTLIRSFKNKLDIEGYFKNLEEKERKKKAVEIAYAYIIQFILYKTLVDNDFGKFKKQFQDISENIYECLKVKRYGEILGNIEGISNGISQNIYRPFIKEQEFISNTLRDLIRKPKKELHDVSPWLDIFIFVKNYNFTNVKNEIFGYIYENYLKELYEDTKKGQYFTDPAVVNFMLEQVGYTKENLTKRLKNKPEGEHISIIDPSCGSGTFLYSAVDRIIDAVPDGSEETSKKIEELINNNVFGLDIAEFPLYLAEMNILMRLLPLIINEKYNNPIDKKIKVFKTNDSIAEFILDRSLENTANDIDIAGKQGSFLPLIYKDLNVGYESYMRDEDDLKDMKQSMRPPRKRFDFVIGNPPYVSYNECSRQGVLVFNLMKKHKVSLNNIYGINLHSIPEHSKKYAPKPNLYAFFIALGIRLLKDNGKLCFIIPQTILTAGDLDVLRYHLAQFTTIEKIITFSGNMFIGRGLKQNKAIATSSLIFVIRRETPDISRNQIELIHYKNSDDDIEKCLQNISTGRKIKRKKILQNKLLQNKENWNFIKQDKLFLDFYEEYQKSSEDISVYYNHTMAELKFKSKFYFDGGGKIDENKIQNEAISSFEIFDYKKNDYNKYLILNANPQYYSKKAKIDFPQGSQGIVVFLQKYKVIWRTKDSPRFQFCDKDILLVGNQSLTISSNNKTEILYLLSIMNCSTNKVIIAKNLLQENEQSFFIPITGIKRFIRVPKITEDNQFIKDEIIKRTEEMLALEDVKLSDLVDFSGVMTQKFDGVSVSGNSLVLEKDGNEIKCKIKKDAELVKNTIKEIQQDKKLFKEGKIIFSELKNMPAIDFEKQKKIKDYIDDLVFALYFNAPIEKTGIEKAGAIKKECEKNKFYKIIENKHVK